MTQCICLKMACNSKKAGCRVKRTELLRREDSSNTYGMYLTLQGSRLFWGHSVDLPQFACISKTAGRRAKGSEIWDSWILVIHIWGTFDL